ncbi:hypothetical protein K2P97_03240 [bacterium]|nr:hypothetical protein [bacterium]
MKLLNFLKKWISILIVLSVIVWVFVINYSFVFKKRIVGEVVAAEKVVVPMAVVTSSPNTALNPQVFSFSVGVKDRHTGEIYVASSEDRQWAAVNIGNCVIAAYFPYPPWQLSKGNTNHNARLLRNFTSCDQLPEQSWFDSLKFFFLF